MNVYPCVTIHPGRQGGSPCIGDTRIPTEGVARMVLSGMDVNRVCELYQLEPRAVLTACWYEAVHSRRKLYRREWGGWAKEAGKMLWHTDGPLPEPPKGVS